MDVVNFRLMVNVLIDYHSKERIVASKFPGRDSDEEEYFSWYCEELKDAGILNNYFYHNTVYDMIAGSYYTAFEQKKKSIKGHRYTLCQPKTYQPDFMLVWNMEHKSVRKFIKVLTDVSDHNFCSDYDDKNRFFWCQNRPISMSSHIDIKPGFTRRDSDVAVFSWKRTLMLEKYKINVQAVVIEDLFKKTFTPKQYMLNDTGKAPRCKRIEKKNVPISNLKETVTLEEFILPTK